MADGIQIVLSAGTSSPAIPLLRSMLESLFSLKYIHLKDYERRSLCWLCGFIHQEISAKEMVHTETEAGKEFYSIIGREHTDFPARSSEKASRLHNDVSQFKELLRRPSLSEIETEYQDIKRGSKNSGPSQCRRTRSGPPKWHRLYGGPTNIFELARAVKMLSEYRLFYQRWSTTVHGTDAARFVIEQKDGSAEFKQLRFLEFPEHQKDGAELFLQLAAQLMSQKFLTEDQVERLLDDFELSLRDTNSRSSDP
jgi:hypothetical protein